MSCALSCLLLPYSVADGAHNMATDEVLLRSAQQGMARLRFYGWSAPTVSLGYFQPAAIRQADPLLAALPYVRRPTGGATLVHHYEVTYALALPADRPWQTGQLWLGRMHTIIACALAQWRLSPHLQEATEQGPPTGVLCFLQPTPGDLLIGSSKVGGSAQRKQRGALLQHGALLLARSPYTPALPGIRELTKTSLNAAEVCEAIVHEFARDTGWALVRSTLTEHELDQVEEAATDRYGQPVWNDKR
jgi:lipoate-protein ligase A